MPHGCSGLKCRLVATWEKQSTGRIRFELGGKAEGFVTLALSTDKTLVSIACLYIDFLLALEGPMQSGVPAKNDGSNIR